MHYFIAEFMMTNSEYHIAIGDIEFGLEDNDDVNINDQTSILEVSGLDKFY